MTPVPFFQPANMFAGSAGAVCFPATSSFFRKIFQLPVRMAWLPY